jgi:lysyl-tRNA synthetase, class II
MAEDELNNKLVEEKIKKLNEIKQKGVIPYPYSYKKEDNAKDINEKYSILNPEEKKEDKISCAGRIMNLRRMGKATFLHIQDMSGRLQVYFRENDIGEEKYSLLKLTDIGDFIGVEGTIFKTKTGEVTIYAKSFEFLSKSIQPLPEKYHGLTDKEIRYRQRYVDLIMNPEVKEVFLKRSMMIKAIRDFLDNKGFIEVETPLLQTQYGGANARPFKTYINAWNMPMYLSISPELYLKRLIVGGFEKVYTICKNFRNEGVDQSHNPEFTMIELYQSYADYKDMMKLIEECYEYVALKVNGTTKVKHIIDNKEIEIDFKAPWPRKTTAEIIKDNLNIDIENMTKEQLIDFLKNNKIEIPKEKNWGNLVLTIFDELIEDRIIQPTHIYDRPKEGTPLCKIHRKNEKYNEQCEPIALGMEIGNMYSELNDPIIQKKLFKEQEEKGRGGDEEAHPMDYDFLNCLEIGMPPTGGIGWGIDRMAILLLGQSSIRDVIFFPTMKPKTKENEEK